MWFTHRDGQEMYVVLKAIVEAWDLSEAPWVIEPDGTLDESVRKARALIMRVDENNLKVAVCKTE